jgi:hypothetical protein
LFGHEIELLPRVLVLDHSKHPWLPGEVIRVAPFKTQPTPGTNPPSRSMFEKGR